MRIIQSVLLALALTLSTSVFAQVQLKLKAGVAQNFGVATELLKGTAQASTYTLDARVLDPSSLYSQTEELQASNSALALSNAQAARVGRLYRNQQNATQAALAQATLTALNDQKRMRWRKRHCAPAGAMRWPGGVRKNVRGACLSCAQVGQVWYARNWTPH